MISIPICLYLPKRFPLKITILVLLYCFVLAKSVDFIAGVPPFDLYDINDSSKYELFDVLTYLLYLPFGYIFLYLYDRWKIQEVYVVLYIVSCSLLGVLFEMVTVMSHIFNFSEWRSIYSIPVYLSVQSSLILFHKIISNKKVL
jgi:hypothetical protein